MGLDNVVEDVRVLAIASHVSHGYVGNKMATFVMQSLGCDVTAINTTHYSNHLAYKRVRGTKTPASEILDLYEGLRQSNLNTFDVLLTGYMPSAEVVRTVGKVGRDLKFEGTVKPGGFFWVLDPVMGDNGKLYVPEEEVEEYKGLLREADLILPNQFEAELLSGVKITDLKSLVHAIEILHEEYHIPHIIITSLRLDSENKTLPSRPPSTIPSATASGTQTPKDSTTLDAATSHPSTWPTSTSTTESSSTQQATPSMSTEPTETLTMIGSTATSTHKPRLFRIDTPLLPLFFSGTGDMFAALTVPRLIEAITAASVPPSEGDQTATPNLRQTPSWRSPDDVKATDLPLASAAQKVLASMQAILSRTATSCAEKMAAFDAKVAKEGRGQGEEADAEKEGRRWRELMRGSEVGVVRWAGLLREPVELEKFEATDVLLDPKGEEKEE